MKNANIWILGALLAQCSFAADLTGKWAVMTTNPAGQTTETDYFLTATGDTFTGYIGGQPPQPITDGKANGNNLTFTVSTQGRNGDITKAEYTATVTPDGLLIKAPGGGGRGGGAGFAGGRGGRGGGFGFGEPPAAGAGAGGRGGAGRGAAGGNGAATELLAKRISTAAPPPMPPVPAKLMLPIPPAGVRDNGLARTPPMGWNSWNKFQRGVNDQVVREVADAMAKNGMKDAGYQYVNIDDTWEGTRDEKGNIRSNEKFPDMKALADYVHSKGLKLGIYSSPGPKTCAGFEGSYQHEEQDAKTFAAWGIDYLKYDWCTAGQVYEMASEPGAYAKMGQALLDSGRAIVYSLCQYGALDVGEWGAKAGGNLWRTTGDIRDNWASMSGIGFDQQPGREKYAQVGHWNDPDMLEIGNGEMTDTEYRTHMSLWSMLSAPLLAGNDLRNVAPDILDILTNKEVIAINQDSLGKQGMRVAKDGDIEVWVKPLADGSRAVGLFNRGAATARATAKWQDLGLTGPQKVRDVWTHADRGTGSDAIWADVPSHGAVLLKISH